MLSEPIVPECRVKLRIGGIHIWLHIKDTRHTTGQCTYQKPADKRKIQNKGFPLLSIHHFLADPQCLPVMDIRLLGQNIRDHAVGIAHHDSRDHKQQSPQSNKQILHKHNQHGIPVKPTLKAKQQLGDWCIIITVLHIKSTGSHQQHLKDKNITAILQQSPTRIWIGTEGGGLFLYNPQTGTIKNYSHTSKTANCISSDYVRSLALDSQHRLWIGTINSLNIYNEQEDNFNIYTSDPLENGSLSQMSVRNIFMDTQGGMWLGTYFGGINYYHPLKNRFRNLQFTAKPNSLNSNIINCIREDAQKGLWIGTNGGGEKGEFVDCLFCSFEL